MPGVPVNGKFTSNGATPPWILRDTAESGGANSVAILIVQPPLIDPEPEVNSSRTNSFHGAAYGSAAQDLDEPRLARVAVVGDNRDTHSLKATFFYWSWRSKPARVLIGNNLGKVNGWVEANGILGKVVAARLKSYLLDAHRFML